MKRPAHLSDAAWAEYQQCQAETDDLMAQVADRERQIENGWISSYDEYEFDYGPLPEPHSTPEKQIAGPGLPTHLVAFADALAARLPGAWSARLIWRLPAEDLWDNGHVSWAVEEYGENYPGAELRGPEGEALLVIDRPFYPDQFLIAAHVPAGFAEHHFHTVEEPHGIAVSDQPARAAAQVTGRLLPRYHRARAAVQQRAHAEPAPPEPPAPAHASLTMEWNARDELIVPDSQVTEPAQLALLLNGFRHRPEECAYALPARWADQQAAYLQAAARGLAEHGIGLILRPGPTPTAHAVPTVPPAHPRRPHR